MPEQPSTSKGGNAPIVRQGQTTSGAYGSEFLAKRRGTPSAPKDVKLS